MGNVSDKFVEIIKPQILCSVIFFSSRKSRRSRDNVCKIGTARQAQDGNRIRRMRIAWRIN